MKPDSAKHDATILDAPWLSRMRRGILFAVSSFALLVTSYLVSMKWSGRISQLPGCGGSEGCANLLGGRWGSWFLVPVSVWAGLIYLALVGLSASGLRRWGSRTVALALGLLLALSALWFLSLQLFVERHFCFYCNLLHACGFVIVCLLWQSLWSQGFPGRSTAVQTSILLAVGGLLALMGGQLWGPQPATHEIRQLAAEDLDRAGEFSSVPTDEPPPELVVTETPVGTTHGPVEQRTTPNSAPATPTLPESSPTFSAGPRTVTLMDGKWSYVVGELPLIGDPAAEHVIVKCFDYTCDTCREMHNELERLVELYPHKIAVILAPTPLNRSCNPYVVAGVPDHRGACHLARLALAVWRANPTAFADFHHEIFRRQRRVTVAEARDEATRRVGLDALERAELDPWIAQVLRQNAEVYRDLCPLGPQMPKLLLGGTSVMNGLPRDTAALIEALQPFVALD